MAALLLNVVTGGERDEQARFGDHLAKAERYARTDEFLTVLRGAWSGEPFDFKGEHYDVRGATVLAPPDPLPHLYFGGSSPEAGPVAARHVDTYLTWGEPPAQAAQKLAWIRGLAREHDREMRFGIRFHVVARDTAAEAWAAAERLIEGVDPAHVSQVQTLLAASESTGQARMSALHERFRDGWKTSDLEIYPNVWAGWGCCAAAPAPRWSAATPRSPTVLPSTRTWGSRSSSCPGSRTWRRRTWSARAFCPNYADEA